MSRWFAQLQPPGIREGMCPAGCGNVQPPGKFLCATCWAKLPRGLRREVYQTWDAYRDVVRLPPEHPERGRRIGEAREDYAAARKTALEAIA